MNHVLALIALAILAGFLLILILEVPSPDLIAVALLTFALVAFDFLRSMGQRR